MDGFAPDGTPEELADFSIERRRTKQKRQAEEFVRGPLPLDWFVNVGSLPGKTTQLALAIWFRKGLGDEEPIRVSPALLRRHCISRFAAYRAMATMEAAGFIAVDRHRGRSPLVTVLQPKAPPLTTTSDEQPVDARATCQCCHCGRSDQ